MKNILFVGTIQPRKNLVALIQAFSLVAGKLRDYRLVIVGAAGWETEEIFSAPARFGIQEKVEFRGRVSESALQELYLGASLYVQPSLTEGFGLPVLEAMEVGVPVIVSDGGALVEVVGDGGVVVGLGANFVTNLASAMERVLTDQKLRNRLITTGYKRVKFLTWDRAAKSTLKLLVE